MEKYSPRFIRNPVTLKLFPLVRGVVDHYTFLFTKESFATVTAGNMVDDVFQRDYVDSGDHSWNIL